MGTQTSVKYAHSWRQACTMRRFLMTTDAEIALASSWKRTMTKVKLSECLVLQRLKSRVRKPEKRWTLVNQQLWKINNQINSQRHSQFHRPVPTVRVGGSSGSGNRAGSGSRANEANTDDRETKRVRFTESRGQKRQGEDVEELAAKAEEQHLDADVQVPAHKTWRIDDAQTVYGRRSQSKTEVFEGLLKSHSDRVPLRPKIFQPAKKITRNYLL